MVILGGLGPMPAPYVTQEEQHAERRRESGPPSHHEEGLLKIAVGLAILVGFVLAIILIPYLF